MLIKIKSPNEITRVLSQPMIDWINENQGKNFWVEKRMEDSVKLKKVDFWLSTDLVEEA